MNKNENTDAIYQMAADLKEDFEQLKLTMKYISEQTGLPIKKVKRFFDLTDEGAAKEAHPEFMKIGAEIKRLFRTERNSNHYQLIDDEEFFKIHQRLREEFNLRSNKQVSLIKRKVNAIFEKQHIDHAENFLDFCINQYGIDRVQDMAEEHMTLQEQLYTLASEGKTHTDEFILLTEKVDSFYQKEYSDFCLYKNFTPCYSKKKSHDKTLKNINTHSIAKFNFEFNVHQQRAILEIYFEACTDNNGYLLPDHFGSGIQLSTLVEEEITFVRSHGAKLNRWASLHGIRKVRPWATEENLKSYHYGDKLPETDKSDPIYQFIAAHKRVFFHDSSIKHMSDILKMIKDSPDEVGEQVLDLLKGTFSIVIPKSEKACEYYKTISEYFDILSIRPPVDDISEYSKERIYRIVYEISAESDGAILFSNELVEQTFRLIKLNATNWAWRMYISYYYFKHREIDSLVRCIEIKTKEYGSIDIE